MENNKDLSWKETHALNIKELDDRFNGSLSERLESESENDAGIIYNIRNYGWSPLRGNKVPEDSNVEQSHSNGYIKPLLVVSFKDTITEDQARRCEAIFTGRVRDAGWTALVVDDMDESKVQAFGIDAPLLSELSLDSVIELLEGLKRVKEAQDGIGGSPL